MTDTSTDRPFNGFFTPTPFRIPNLILWGSGVVIGFGMLLVGYFTNAITSGLAPMYILIGASVVVSGCTLIAYKQRGGLLALYSGAVMLILVSGWIAFDGYQTHANTRVAERQLASDLTELCHNIGGEALIDPACAEHLRVLNNYRDAKRGETSATAP